MGGAPGAGVQLPAGAGVAPAVDVVVVGGGGCE
jgi:hypothetical protein